MECLRNRNESARTTHASWRRRDVISDPSRRNTMAHMGRHVIMSFVSWSHQLMLSPLKVHCNEPCSDFVLVWILWSRIEQYNRCQTHKQTCFSSLLIVFVGVMKNTVWQRILELLLEGVLPADCLSIIWCVNKLTISIYYMQTAMTDCKQLLSDVRTFCITLCMHAWGICCRTTWHLLLKLAVKFSWCCANKAYRTCYASFRHGKIQSWQLTIKKAFGVAGFENATWSANNVTRWLFLWRKPYSSHTAATIPA